MGARPARRAPPPPSRAMGRRREAVRRYGAMKTPPTGALCFFGVRVKEPGQVRLFYFKTEAPLKIQAPSAFHSRCWCGPSHCRIVARAQALCEAWGVSGLECPSEGRLGLGSCWGTRNLIETDGRRARRPNNNQEVGRGGTNGTGWYALLLLCVGWAAVARPFDGHSATTSGRGAKYDKEGCWKTFHAGVQSPKQSIVLLRRRTTEAPLNDRETFNPPSHRLTCCCRAVGAERRATGRKDPPRVTPDIVRRLPPDRHDEGVTHPHLASGASRMSISFTRSGIALWSFQASFGWSAGSP